MDNLKKQRKLVKSGITRVKTFLDGIGVPSPTVQELKVKVNLLDNLWAEYKDMQHRIVELADEDQFDAEARDYEVTEDKYSTTTSGLMLLIDNLETASSTSNGSTPSSTGSNSSENGTNNTQSNESATKADVKLPRMDLPTFTGNQLEWQSFRDLFTSIIHNNPKISNSQKLHYLKNSLQQDAQLLLRSIDITDANYEVAWDLLKERFENERQLIHCHLKALFSQPHMSSECSSQMRKLVDSTTQHIRALKSLGLQTDHWDPIVLHILTDKLDSESRREWELSSPGKTFPMLKELTTFLEQRCRALEVTSTSKPKHNPKVSNPQHFSSRSNSRSHFSAQSKTSCILCKSSHYLYQCGEFTKLDTWARSDFVKANRLCSNCLRSNHAVEECRSTSSCRTCNGKHHSLLHFVRAEQSHSLPKTTQPSTSTATHHSNNQIDQLVLLKTALVQIEDNAGIMQTCRAFLDDGSQSCLITDACVKRLGLPKSRITTTINGVGSSSIHPCGKVNFTMHSRNSPFSIAIQATVLKNLTGHLPQTSINIRDWTHLHNLALADYKFNEPGEIDILLGADVYEDILTDGKIEAGDGLPIARRTHLGWVLSGKVSNQHTTFPRVHIATTDVSDQLKKFWELEELGETHHLTNEEKSCESTFASTTTRDSNGRYTVSIPFKQTGTPLGLSKTLCMNRLQSVEKRLQNHPQYKLQYQQFMDEYLSLGHMEPVPFSEQAEVPTLTNYLPHHFVLKEGSTTTSLRVVFDASCKTSTSVSLNQTMMTGPTLQDDLHTILLRFRIPTYVFTADVAKMYRQIQVTPENANLQRILWRKEPWLPILEYRLKTVTYGTASAPYLATKALRQLAVDDGHLFPMAKEATLNSFYVDDIMCGENALEDALQLQAQLINMLRGGGFHLRKWSANHTALLESVPVEDRETALPLCIDANESIKALGLHWSPAADYMFFKVKIKKMQTPITKRILLSETAKLFDPLGWLAPVIIIAKKMFQQLWLLGLTWDAELPRNMQETWNQFASNLHVLEELRIPRHVGGDANSKYQLHGFSDASEQAYSAVLYLRAESQNSITTHLLTSKTKVAPVKQISIPRLELCGATLLARLMKKAKKAIKLEFEFSQAWTDSTISLDWIRQHPSKWTTFVANRVGEIQSHVDPSTWRHVPSADNPADCASRGLMPEDLLNFQLWWKGPPWLALDKSHWPAIYKTKQDTTLEQKKSKIMLATTDTPEWNLLCKYSSLTTLKRVAAWQIRFIYNLKCNITGQVRSENLLSTSELQHALLRLIVYVQNREFPEAMQNLKIGKNPPSRLAFLNPFLDCTGILRVGGRLRNSTLHSDHKHPILLPKSHHLTKLIIIDEHVKHLHAGPQLVLSMLNQHYWILNGRNVIRSIIHNCIRCTRLRANMASQLMGDLPSYRVQAGRAFLKTGVDYAGPLIIKSQKGRGGKTSKCYISFFICLSTKATHLELVSELTAEAFLAAFRRFASRRGKPSDMYSDNGTNFVGANKELKQLTTLVRSQQFNSNLSQSLGNDGIMWHFIPAGAPHFGGLWEAGIKSAKKHLTRVVGEQVLTFEELYTVLTQIEACLNSRPICQISTNPVDLTPLTPGHFLVGEPLTSIPDPDLTNIQINRLSRWQLVQQLNQHFWKRWHLEYLSSLQQRTKWRKKQPNLEIGDLVIIKEDNSPPLRWRMGRIVQTHSGKDNLVRAVTLKTINGLVKRPIVKLSVLPVQ